MGKWCLHASSFIFDRIIIKVAGNQDKHKSLDEFYFGPLVSMAHLYVFEMRFDLGTLDSGERSLPFGLLVFDVCLIFQSRLALKNHCNLKAMPLSFLTISISLTSIENFASYLLFCKRSNASFTSFLMSFWLISYVL